MKCVCKKLKGIDSKIPPSNHIVVFCHDKHKLFEQDANMSHQC